MSPSSLVPRGHAGQRLDSYAKEAKSYALQAASMRFASGDWARGSGCFHARAPTSKVQNRNRQCGIRAESRCPSCCSVVRRALRWPGAPTQPPLWKGEAVCVRSSAGEGGSAHRPMPPASATPAPAPRLVLQQSDSFLLLPHLAALSSSQRDTADTRAPAASNMNTPPQLQRSRSYTGLAERERGAAGRAARRLERAHERLSRISELALSSAEARVAHAPLSPLVSPVSNAATPLDTTTTPSHATSEGASSAPPARREDVGDSEDCTICMSRPRCVRLRPCGQYVPPPLPSFPPGLLCALLPTPQPAPHPATPPSFTSYCAPLRATPAAPPLALDAYLRIPAA